MQLVNYCERLNDSAILGWLLFQLAQDDLGCPWCVYQIKDSFGHICCTLEGNSEEIEFKRQHCMPGIRQWVLHEYQEYGTWIRQGKQYQLQGVDDLCN